MRLRTVRYRMRSAPLFVHCCHCLRCQRETGSAFVLNALDRDRPARRCSARAPAPVAVPDRQRQVASHLPLRKRARSRSASEYGGVEKLRFLRVGTLDAPHALTPDVHIYTRSKVPWIAPLPASRRLSGSFGEPDQRRFP